MFRLLGTLPASEVTTISKHVTREVLQGKTYSWVGKDAVTNAINDHLKTNNIRADSNTKGTLFRLVSQDICRRLLKDCAQSLSVELASGRVKGHTQFIVHNFMNPWVLIEEHAAHLRHPEKDWVFWHSRPHREWVDGVIEIDGFVPDLIEGFEAAFSDWIESGYIRKVAESDDPVRSALYEVRSTAKTE